MIYAYGDDIPQLSLWIKRSKSADLDLLVELRRIELLSEKTLIGLSPGAVCLLVLPHMTADRQAVMIGSFFLYDRFKS